MASRPAVTSKRTHPFLTDKVTAHPCTGYL